MTFHTRLCNESAYSALVQIELTIWQKHLRGAKAWSAISYILLISFSLHGKKGDAAKSIFKMCVHFQNIKFGVQAPLVQIELTVWQKNRDMTKGWSAIHISFWFLLLASMARKGMQPKAFLKCAFIFKASNLVVRNFIYDTMQMPHHIYHTEIFLCQDLFRNGQNT